MLGYIFSYVIKVGWTHEEEIFQMTMAYILSFSRN